MNQNLWINDESQADQLSHFTDYAVEYRLNHRFTLLLSGLTGAMDVLDTEDVAILKETPEVFVKNRPQMASRLAARGFLFESRAKERGIKTCLVEKVKTRLRQREMLFMLCPTDSCPMGCSHCFAGDLTSNASRKMMSSSMAESAFESISKIRDELGYKLSTVVLYGGEPFQSFTGPVLEKVFQLACDYGLKIAGFSNGYEMANHEELISKYQKHIAIFSVTLDGPKQRHNARRKLPLSFDRAVQSIDMLMKMGVPVQVKMNMNKQNIQDIPEMTKFYKEKGWWENKRVQFELNPIRYGLIHKTRDTTTDIDLALDFLDMQREASELSRYDILPLVDNKYFLLEGLGIYKLPLEAIPINIEVPKIHHCPSYSKHVFVFTANGRIYLCNEEVGRDSACHGGYDGKYEFYKAGMDNYYQRDITTLPKCRDCAFAFFCGGGCGAHAGIGHQSHNCLTIKEDFKAVVNKYSADILKHIKT